MDPAPENKPQETGAYRGKGAGCAWYLWGPLAVCFVYVLSTGPAARYYQGRVVPKPVETFYAPIVILGGSVPPVGHFLQWYTEQLWAPRLTAPGASPNTQPVGS